MKEPRTRANWLVYALGALCAGAVAAAILVVGPASGSQATVTRTAKVAQGVVQSTVSGTGNLQAASQLSLGFGTGGTVSQIYVKEGQQVTEGQLLATLNPESGEVTLEQAKASLQSAEANLAKEQETDGEGSSASPSSSSGGASGTSAAAASVHQPSTTVYATVIPPATQTDTTTTPTTATTPSTTTPGTTTPTSPSPTTATTKPKTQNSSSRSTVTTKSGGNAAAGSTGTSSTSTKSTISTATREANLASAKAAVRSDRLAVQSDEQSVQDTKLYAPESGTIVSLTGQVGEVVSGSGTTRASSANSSSSGSSSSSTAGTGAAGGRSSTTSGSGATSSSSSSSSAFAILSDLSSMQLVAPLSESEIGSIRMGQIATVTVEALEGRKLAAHVSEVATLSTSNSGVVSYDVTFELDQMTSGLKPGMSASAEVVVKQAQGLSVPSSAISAATVTVVRGGKHVRQRVVTGLAGNSSTIVLSGLKAGETVVLPSVSTSGTGTSSSTRRGALGGAGAGGGFPGGGAALFRGGG